MIHVFLGLLLSETNIIQNQSFNDFSVHAKGRKTSAKRAAVEECAGRGI